MSAAEIGAEPGLHRLHPASLLINVVQGARKFLLPGLLVLVFARGDRWELWLMLLFVPAALHEVLHVATLRYGTRGDQLVVRSGLLFRGERHIPLDRIQNLDLVQTPLHRLFGVADVQVETASGQEPEAVLRVLSLAEVARLRQELGTERRGRDRARAPASERDGDSLLQLGFFDLLLLGLLSLRGLALLAAALGAAYEFDLFPWLRERFAGETERLESMPRDALIRFAGLVTGGIVALVLLLSMAWSVVRLHGFRLSRHGPDLRTVCGLFTRFAATIPRRRVQVLCIHEGLLHRLLGKASVRVETAGGAESEETQRHRKWFAPMLDRREVAGLLGQVLPGTQIPANGWQGLCRRGRRRLRIRRLLPALLVPAATVPLLGPAGLALAGLLVPIALLSAALEGRFRAFRLDADAFWLRSGGFERRTSVVPLARVQLAHLRSNPLDRRHGMATLGLDTAGSGPNDHRIEVPYLDRRDAERLLDTITQEVARRPLEW